MSSLIVKPEHVGWTIVKRGSLPYQTTCGRKAGVENHPPRRKDYFPMRVRFATSAERKSHVQKRRVAVRSGRTRSSYHTIREEQKKIWVTYRIKRRGERRLETWEEPRGLGDGQEQKRLKGKGGKNEPLTMVGSFKQKSTVTG